MTAAQSLFSWTGRGLSAARLSVAFIDESGTILNIEDMKPQTEDSHCSARPARYALEMNQGWFARRGIKSGAKIDGLRNAPPGQ